MCMFVRISPPDAIKDISRVDSTGCLDLWFNIPRTIIIEVTLKCMEKQQEVGNMWFCFYVFPSQDKGRKKLVNLLN